MGRKESQRHNEQEALPRFLYCLLLYIYYTLRCVTWHHILTPEEPLKSCRESLNASPYPIMH
jgi:hypothetical protein